MIEDDLRELIGSELPDISVYSRLIPLALPDCIVIQEGAGTPTRSSIRRAIHRITVLGVSTREDTASNLAHAARDVLLTHIPRDSATTHYYTATALTNGSPVLRRKAPNGPHYIASVDMEVVASLP